MDDFHERVLFCTYLFARLRTEPHLDERDLPIVQHAAKALGEARSHGEVYLRGFSTALEPVIKGIIRRSDELSEQNPTAPARLGLNPPAQTINAIHHYTADYVACLAEALAGKIDQCEQSFRSAKRHEAIYDSHGFPQSSIRNEIDDAEAEAESIILEAAKTVRIAVAPRPRGKKVFISYRRSDSKRESRDIYQRLVQQFGKDDVFFDLETVPVGSDFELQIRRSLYHCAAILVVIGKRWVNPKWTRGVASAKDFVLIEVRLAIELNIPVLPILVQRAGMPPVSILHPAISALQHRNALVLEPRNLERIVAEVERLRSGIGDESP